MDNILGIFKRKVQHSKSLNPETNTKRTIKSLRMLLREQSGAKVIKQKIADFIKSNIKEKGIKADTRSTFILIAKTYHSMCINILQSNEKLFTDCTNDHIISFLISFYDFYEDELSISSQDIMAKINKEDLDESYFMSLIGLLNYAKLCECLDAIQDKNFEMDDIAIKTMNLIYLFSKINKHVESAESSSPHNSKYSVCLLVRRVTRAVLPNLITFFSDLIDTPDMKTIFALIETEDLARYFNDLSRLRTLRKGMYDIFSKINSCTKDGIKIMKFKKYITDNNCLEGILSSIKDSYNLNDYSDVVDILKEIIDILIIQRAFFESRYEFKDQIFIFVLKIIEDFSYSTDNYGEFDVIFRNFIQDIFNLSYVDREDLKAKISEKSIERISTGDLISNNGHMYKNLEMIELLLNIFDSPIVSDNQLAKDNFNHIRKIILNVILDHDITLIKYRVINSQTSFCDKVLNKMHTLNEEIISAYFSVLLILSENMNFTITTDSQVTTASDAPVKEMKAIVQSLIKCDKEQTLTLILKYMKTFLDLAGGFQRLIVSCGLFNIVFEILDCTLEQMEQTISDSNRIYDLTRFSVDIGFKGRLSQAGDCPILKTLSYSDTNRKSTPGQIVSYTPEMILKLLNFVELLVTNSAENLGQFKHFQPHDNYFTRFIIFDQFKQVSYKIWSICMINESEPNEIKKYVKSIIQRYYILKDYLQNITSANDYKLVVDEIMNINEIITLKFLKETCMKSLSSGNNQILLKEILLDFVNLLDMFKQQSTNSTGMPENTGNLFENFHTESNENNTLIILNEELKTNEQNDGQNYTWDVKMQKTAKYYLQMLVDLVEHLNKTLFTYKLKNIKTFKKKLTHNSIISILKKAQIKIVIDKLINFLNSTAEEKYLTDLVKFLIDKSLKFKSYDDRSNSILIYSMTEKQPLQTDSFFTGNLTAHFKNAFKVNDTFLNNSCTSVSNLSNFSLNSPMIIKCLTKAVGKIRQCSILADILEFIEFLCKVNENNSKLLLSKSLVNILLEIHTYHEGMSDKILDIFEVIGKFFTKDDVETIFNYFFKSGVNKSTSIYNRTMGILYKNYKLSRKISKHITLSSVNTRQPNIFNILYTGNIHFTNHFNIMTKQKISHLSVFLTLKLHNEFDNASNLILFKLEREGKEKEIPVLEISIEKTNMVIKENDTEIFSSNELTKHIRLDKNTNFIFVISKETNELQIYVNRKLLCVARPEYKFLDLNTSTGYNLLLGYTGANCREIFNDKFETFPHVSLSYLMIYAEKITSENIDQFLLSQIWNSKNGSVLANECKVKYLNEKSYKAIAPSNIINKSDFLNLKLNFEQNKVVYELLADKIDFITNNKIEKLKGNVNVMNNFFFKIQRRYHIDVLEKDFICYIPYTNYLNVGEDNYPFYNHTYLVSKFNTSDAMHLNTIFDVGKVNRKMINDVLAIGLERVLDIQLRSAEFVDQLLMLMNEMPNIVDAQTQSSALFNTVKLISVHFISNLQVLAELHETDTFKVLLLTLMKCSEMINTETVDIFFNLSFGLENKEITSSFNPWHVRLITDLLLDVNLFHNFPKNIKLHIVDRIKLLTQKDALVLDENDYQTKVEIIGKLYKIILLNENNIDEEMIILIILLVEQVLRFKKGASEPTEEQLKAVVYATLEFLRVSENFSQPISAHLIKRNFNELETDTTSFLIKKIFPKLYSDSLHNIRSTLVNFFIKFSELTPEKVGGPQRRNSTILPIMRIQSIIQPIFALINCIDTSTVITNFSPMFKPRKHEFIESNKFSTRVPSRHNSLMQIAGGSLKMQAKETIININPVSNPMHKKKIKDDYNVITDLKKTSYFVKELDFDAECNGENCLVCNFILSSMDISFSIVRKSLVYKKFIKRFFYSIFIKHIDMDDYLDQKGISFSWNVLNREGPARIKKKFIAKLDSIKNEEMVKKYYDESKPEKIFSFENINRFERYFDFLNIRQHMSNIIYNDQIFRLNFTRRTVENDDVCEMSFNCLLFKGMHETNCVIIIGDRRFYILKNVHIDKNDSLLDCKIKFHKFFWAISNYDDEWERACPYLNGYTRPKLNTSHSKDDEDKGGSADKYKSLIKSICSRKNGDITNKFTRRRNEFKILTFSYREINEMHKRKFLHQNNSIEIFTKSGKNFLLAFNVDKRDYIYKTLIHKIQSYLQTKTSKTNTQFITDNSMLHSNYCIFMNNSAILLKKEGGKLMRQRRELVDSKSLLKDIQEKWVRGIISNYDYLMMLNTLGGRSYNDLSQYPVFPWIIKDYTTDGINLNDENIYRNLAYPIYALEKNSREALKLKYEGAEGEGRYHSGTHYSNPGFTSYYLIRLKPFANIAAEIQGGYFDTSDRLFFNIKSLWDVSDKYQELIPEMYYLPETLVNFNEFNFGMSQSQIYVKDVLLPEWARKDPRLFVKMAKKAMESFRVSEKISDWIDLIFGYKQTGGDAASSLNVFRDVCYPFDPNHYVMQLLKEMNETNTNMGQSGTNSTMIQSVVGIERIYDDLETKMNEICDMGQNPIQIFSKPHLRKDRHPKSKAVFSRCAYLMNIKKREKEYKIRLDSKPKMMKGYYECSESYLSHGEGGLSSFRSYYEEDDKITKGFDAYNTFFLVGGNKVLLGPKYKNFIDFGQTKYSLVIVKPYSKLSFEFPTMKDSPICDVIATNNGKIIIVGFQDGSLGTYKLKKIPDRFMNPEFEKRKEKGLFGKIFSNRKESGAMTRTSTILETNQSMFKQRETMMSSKQFPEIKDTDIFSTKINYLNSEDLRDYYTHNNIPNKFANTKEASKGTTFYKIIPGITNSSIQHPIKFMELNETYSLLIVVDVMNLIYLFEMNKFLLIRQMNFSEMMNTKQDIKTISICDLTGDFVVATSYCVALFNVNGVLLGDLDLLDNTIYKLGKITTVTVKSLKNTESDIHLFTGHEDGAIIMWKVENKYISEENMCYMNTTTLPNNQKEENFLDSYRFAYNRKYYKEHFGKPFDLKLRFDIHLKIEEKRIRIRLIKLVEDMSQIIVIYDDMSLLYFGYEDYLDKKKAPKVKNCPQCNSQLGSSKIECVLCKKKLCGLCKIEKKIPHISFKVAKPICEDCFKMNSSTNKMLYDF